MKYFITGASGQLGREWLTFLKNSDSDFISFTSSELDITNANRVLNEVKSQRPDVIINCAAYTKVDQAESEAEKAYAVNEAGVENLAKAAKMTGSKLVHYSTDYVFSGSRQDQEKYPDGYPENAPVDPMNVYGKSKLAGEKVIENSGVNHLLIRTSWLCSPNGKNFVNTMLRLGSERDKISVVDDQIGSPSYTFDVVEKTSELLNMNASGTYHLTSEGKISWADFAVEIFKQVKISVEVLRITSSEFKVDAKRPSYSLLSTKKLKNFGCEVLNWKKGLDQLLEKRQ